MFLSDDCQVLFERRRKYNIPVWLCVHPELNQYIKDVLVGTRTLIRKGEMEKVVLAISDKVMSASLMTEEVKFRHTNDQCGQLDLFPLSRFYMKLTGEREMGVADQTRVSAASDRAI